MNAIGRSITLLLVASLVARGLGMVRSLWLARLLAPADYGGMVFLLLIAAYAPIFSLGTVETLLKKVPYFIGRGDLASARDVERGTFTFVLLLAAAFAAATLIARPALGPRGLSRYVLPTQAMLLSLSFSVMSAFYYHRLEAYKRFDRVSVITTARSVATLALQVAGAAVAGLPGAILGYAAAEIAVCGVSLAASRVLPSRLKLLARLGLFVSLVRTGIPITIAWWTYVLQTTVDRLFAMTMLGETATGFYGVGMSLAAAYLVVPETIAQVLYPDVSEAYGRSRQAVDLADLVVAPARVMGLILPMLTCAFVLVLPVLFALVVPRYLPGLPAAQILLIGALFSGLMRTGANLLVSTDRQATLLALVAGALVLNVAGNFLLLHHGWGIEGIAISTAASSALLSLAVWAVVLARVGLTGARAARVALSLFGPAVILGLLALGIRRVTAGAGTVGAAAGLGVHLLACVILVAAVPAFRRDLKAAWSAVRTVGARRGAAPEQAAREGVEAG